MQIFSKRATDAKSQTRILNETREQIEIYLESCVRMLEGESEGISTGFLEQLLI